MTKRQAMAAALIGAALLILGLVSAILEPAEPEQICLRAQDRLVDCRDELTRPRVLIFARRKQQEALDACQSSEPTVDMYENCLAKADCKAFAECLEAYATEPVKPAATTPGRRQSAQPSVQRMSQGAPPWTTRPSKPRPSTSRRETWTGPPTSCESRSTRVPAGARRAAPATSRT